MSLSDRMPGYRNKSQVPPMASRPSSTAKVLPEQRRFKWTAAPIPEIPAPTIITSKDSIFSRSLCSLPLKVSRADKRSSNRNLEALKVYNTHDRSLLTHPDVPRDQPLITTSPACVRPRTDTVDAGR